MKTTTKKTGKAPAIYDKERTKSKLIKAVGKILVKEGFQNVRINKVAEVAGVAKKGIYEYFGGLDGLIKAYLSQVDFWQIEKQKLEANNDQTLPDITKDFMLNLLKADFQYFLNSAEMQKIVLWGISEKNKAIRALADEREELGATVFHQADEIFKGTKVDYRATIAILVSAIYYTVLHVKGTGGNMCGIDVSSKEGTERMFKAMDRLLQLTYKYADIKL
ncbi:TetR/AcrR family transcriptional regulator [Niabella beijingensis]|uniref:TetR/AcrR family transcriptional regulator n=1 Tax=Niabella beijingensis TaxID=2872700 RepID=UPI001CC02F68|nr:TetR/AcrR family transcriptional regulator [Niabella beijingensis]MBZ4187641.1 TetR/AcrR family transcriptional regulator [Niabella beijingensis]